MRAGEPAGGVVEYQFAGVLSGIPEKRPTLMIDEGDTVLHRNKELRGILNSGYAKKTAYVVRVAYEQVEGSPVKVDGNGKVATRFTFIAPQPIIPAGIGSGSVCL